MKKMPIWALLVCGIVSVIIIAFAVKFVTITGRMMISSDLTEDLKKFNCDDLTIEVTIEVDDFVPDWAPATPDTEMTSQQKNDYHKTICEGYFKRLNLSGYDYYTVYGISNDERFILVHYETFADAVIDIFTNFIVSDIRHINLIHIDYHYEFQIFTQPVA